MPALVCSPAAAITLCWIDQRYRRVLLARQMRTVIISQWLWNLRLEPGQPRSPPVMRVPEFAPAHVPEPAPGASPAPEARPAGPMLYGPAQWARKSFTGGFPGSAFTPQPDGTLLCPAKHPLYPQERRPERDGSYRVLYAARIGDCQRCAVLSAGQESRDTTKPRRG